MKPKKTRVLMIVGLLFLVAQSAAAQVCPGSPGCLDPSFGLDGKQLVANSGSYPRDVAVLSDGSIVSLVDNKSGIMLVKVRANGSVDTSFDTDGTVHTDWHFYNTLPRGYPYALAVQTVDGEERLVVAGSWTVASGRSSVTMLRVDRYRSDGSRDNGFGTNGTVLVNKPYALAVAIQPIDNKIITVGDGQAVVRLNVDGSVDTTFGPNGDGATGAGQAGWAIKGLSDGSIVIGGSYSQNSGTVMCVTKLNPNGAIFESFGTAGRATANFYGRGSFARAFDLEVDPFGNIVVGGTAKAKSDSNYNYAAARFSAAGRLDTAFNGTGMVVHDFTSLSENGRGIVVQRDGKITFIGSVQVPGAVDLDYGLVRFNFNGTIDTSFGSNGRVTTDFGGPDYAQAARIWIDPSCDCEKIVMSGASSLTGVSFARYAAE